MKIATIVGTRPEIIRLSRVMAALDIGLQNAVIGHEARLRDAYLRLLGPQRPVHPIR